MVLALMLAACTTSSPPTSSRATPKEISAFVGLAEKGVHNKFSATYRTVDTMSITGKHITVMVTALQESWPTSATLSAPTHFKYEQSGEDEILFGAFRSSHSGSGERGQDYACFPGHHATWSCSQIGPGNAGSLLTGAYLPLNTLSGLQALTTGVTVPDLQHDVYLTEKVVAGRKLTCLNFGSDKRPRATVCLTGGGIIGYYSSQVRASIEGPLGTTSLVSLSFHVTKADLTLPAKATTAPGL
jgi:hypothetical protein